jgi:hypothetical protein
MSCPDKCRVPEELWAPKQPDNEEGYQAVLGLNFDIPKHQFGLNDIFGSFPQRLLCMVSLKIRLYYKIKNNQEQNS